MRITAVTCVKNEGPFVLEWVAFHRLIGVSDFLFYSNDCDDGTDHLLNVLARHGGVVHLPNPAQGRNYQMEALKDAAHQPVVRGADWVWVADVDEFPNIHAPGHRLPDLIRACGNPQAISLSFQFFANAGVAAYQDQPVIAQFPHCHNPDIWTDQTAIEVKTLMRADFPLRYFGAHRPFVKRGVAPDALPQWTDGSGRAVPQSFVQADNPRRMRKFPARGARHWATLNHYALRSRDSYLIKTDRGDVNRENRAFDDSYWRDRNDAAWTDRSIQRYLPALTQALAALKAVPEIGAAHRACVEAHRAKFAALKAQPSYQTLVAQLDACPPLPVAETALRARLGYDSGARA